MPFLLIASRMTANAWAPTSPSGTIVGIVEIKLVDLLLGYEFVDFDSALALERDGLELFRIDLDVFPLADLVALDDVGGIDLVPGFGIHLAVLDAMTGLLVELMEADLFTLRCRRKERDRAGDERELKVTFPICAWGHGLLRTKATRVIFNQRSRRSGVPLLRR